MINLYEGDKRIIPAVVRRRKGSGPITLTTPQRRILDSSKTVVSGFDWASAFWDVATGELSCLFDSSLAGLSAVGSYYVQLRGTIGLELYICQITVQVRDLGP